MPPNLAQCLQSLADPGRAAVLARFFKTGKGQYGEGDVFLGLTVPQCRNVAKEFLHLPPADLTRHLSSRFHEERLTAYLILVGKYEKEAGKRKGIFDFYLKNAKYANNWDLVDLTADKIVGRYLCESGESIVLLHKLARSANLWERRIAIIATFTFIKRNRFRETFLIAEKLLYDKHDLIHKAVGWMLREVGKRNQRAAEEFLQKHYRRMPRTMLRYAIERFPEGKRKYYLAKAT